MDLAARGIDTWIFDLDNTLYSPDIGLFKQIDARMGAYIMRLEGCDAATARIIQKRYFHDHGTTLAGLMRHHGVAPDHFLDDVHAVDLSVLPRDPALRDALAALPGRRHIFTNADAAYATRVLDAIGIGDLFETIVDIHATGYVPKPDRHAYAVLARSIPGFDPARSLFIDDMSRNLAPAHAMGMTAIWLDNGSESGSRGHDPAHVTATVDDIVAWLQGVAATAAPTSAAPGELTA